jgi:hypothetical protein
VRGRAGLVWAELEKKAGREEGRPHASKQALRTRFPAATREAFAESEKKSAAKNVGN